MAELSILLSFFIYFLFKDDCFTEICCFLSNLNMNQPYIFLSQDDILSTLKDLSPLFHSNNKILNKRYKLYLFYVNKLDERNNEKYPCVRNVVILG